MAEGFLRMPIPRSTTFHPIIISGPVPMGGVGWKQEELLLGLRIREGGA